MYKAVILDLDGTVYVGTQLTPGAKEGIEELRRLGFKIMFLTNNSMVSRRMIIRKLDEMGIEAKVDEVLNSGAATAIYLKNRMRNVKVFVVGEIGLVEELLIHGHEIVSDYRQAEAVVVGGDRYLTYNKLLDAHRAIIKGALFVATNRDHALMEEDGPVPGAGAVVAYLETSTGVKPIVIGKPERYIADLALQLLNVTPDEAVMVGDNIATDLELAKKAGMRGILIRTGLGKNRVPESITSVNNLLELPRILLNKQ
ncbi:MAG: HAD-IIA family hydrolase [Nitrososphaerota archaeon]